MGRFVALLYGVVAYVVFLAAFLYAIAFVGNVSMMQSIIGDVFALNSIDAGGASASLGTALLINIALLSIFAVQHSVMARPGFKEKWTKIVPEAVERSTYVLLASLALLLMFWQWRPMPDVVWSIGGIGATVLNTLFWVGWGLVLASTVLINHFDLFGLRQVFLNFKEQEYTDIGFRTPMFYKVVRHPIMLGFMIAFWAAPTMTQGHLAFALITTIYMLVGIQLEERDMVGVFGDTYRQYQKDVNMLIPIPKMGGGGDAPAVSTPEPMATVPEPMVAPEPVAAAPEPVAAAPEPIAEAPEPVAAEPESKVSGVDDPSAGPDVSGQEATATTPPESDAGMDDPSVPEPGVVLGADDDEDDSPTPATET